MNYEPIRQERCNNIFAHLQEWFPKAHISHWKDFDEIFEVIQGREVFRLTATHEFLSDNPGEDRVHILVDREEIPKLLLASDVKVYWDKVSNSPRVDNCSDST